MSKKSNYWQKRVERIAIDRDKANVNLIKDIEMSLTLAQREVETKINDWYQRLADANGVSLADAKLLLNKRELKEFKWSVNKYIRIAKNKKLRLKFIKELENASARVHIDRLTALETQIKYQTERVMKQYHEAVYSHLSDQYADDYYRLAFADQARRGKFKLVQAINQTKLDSVIAKPWTVDGKTFSKRIWQRQDEFVASVHKELTRMCIQGDGPDIAISRIAKQFNATKNQAGRLVMTESAFFAAESNKQVYSDLGVDRYEIIATLDNKTSHICQDFDNKVFDYKDYEVGVTAPPFHVWCRSTTAPYFDDEFTAGEKRTARDPDTGKTYYVDSKTSYQDWRKDHVKESPKFKSLKKEKFRDYSEKELNQLAAETKMIADSHLPNVSSKWSGNIRVNPKDGLTGKLWNCDISIASNSAPHILLHEQIHAKSISYYDKAIYRKFAKIEEATVELISKEICKVENMVIIESQYDSLVNTLIDINSQAGSDSVYDFAVKLINVPLVSRLDFLEDMIYDSMLKNGNIDEYQKLSALLDKLR